MVIKIDEPSDIPIANLDKSYKKQNEQIIMARFLARTPDNDIYMLEPTANQGVPKISVGSVIEFNGSIYHVITEALNINLVSGLKDGDCYIKLKIESDTIKAYITNEKPPAFDYVKKGYYKIENETLIKFLFVKIIRKNNLYTNILNAKEDKPDERLPIGTVIPIHYIGANSEIIDSKTPIPNYGVWEKISGGGFFRFKSDNGNEGRGADGVQGDASRKIQASFSSNFAGIILNSKGAFSLRNGTKTIISTGTSNSTYYTDLDFDTSKVVPTSNTENRVYNEGTWEFWKRME